MRKLLALISVAMVAGLAAAIAVPALAASATKKVRVGPQFSFSPKTLTIKKGTKVSWKWAGGLPHNVTVTSGPAKFHSKTQTSGSYSHLFTKKGTYKLVCTIHKALGMKMTVKVT
jgi:plastocyanin